MCGRGSRSTSTRSSRRKHPLSRRDTRAMPKSAYTRTIHKAIVKAVRNGMYPHRAAKLVGLHPSTVNAWLREGEADPESRYRKLWEDVAKAESEYQMEMLEVVNAAARS